ncbi:serine/threonine-protein kinase [Mycolicibacterium mengxianglii]|uniref:serine/threonine-protein kinase n=1 Tax=Mycolicibacterium mengxianglii TaxID=2736649 RepID=UPI0018D0FFB6|nr:serine/threonine-protein kinase [Mycolicibacterium mengxianglii]
MPLTSGELFAGYRILRMIGSGGMGEVYLAQHPRLPRHDALKVLPVHMSADAAFRERFSREADLAAALFHPHIVGVHDRGEYNGQLWISMDYIDGTDAGRLVREQHPSGLPAEQVIEIAGAIAEALDYAHARGLLHRDVKPGNILLANPVAGRRRILLADFGIARSMVDESHLTRTNMALGTVHYASPEQLRNQPLDGRTDQYSLAATTFELLTGRPPFDDPSPPVVMSHHLSSPPPSLARHRPELAALDVPFAIALSKNRGDRYPRCEDFVQALQARASYGRPGARAAAPAWPGVAAPPRSTSVAPPPPPPPSGAAPVPQRSNNALLWPLGIGALVAILVIGALIYYSQSRDSPAGETPVAGPSPTAPTAPSTTTPSTTETTSTFQSMRELVTSYYGQLPGDASGAWSMLSPGYQAQTGGLREYQKFWASIRSVTVESVTPRDDTSVTARLTYVLRNGKTDSEQRWLQVEPVDGTLMITDSGLGV